MYTSVFLKKILLRFPSLSSTRVRARKDRLIARFALGVSLCGNKYQECIIMTIKYTTCAVAMSVAVLFRISWTAISKGSLKSTLLAVDEQFVNAFIPPWVKPSESDPAV